MDCKPSTMPMREAAREEPGRSLQRRGKKATNRGFTVLEVLLGAFLLFIVVMGFLTVRHKKNRLRPIQECEARKWQWVSVAEELEWKLRRWELLAGACLTAGFVPIETRDGEGKITLWEVDSSRPLFRAMTAPNQLPIPSNHGFVVGQKLIICFEGRYVHGKASQIYVGAGDQSLLLVAYDENGETPGLLPHNTLVVGVRPVFLDLESMRGGKEKMLYESRSEKGRNPLVSGLTGFFLTGQVHEPQDMITATLGFEHEACTMNREFALKGTSGLAQEGRWWLRGGEMVHESFAVTNTKGPL